MHRKLALIGLITALCALSAGAQTAFLFKMDGTQETPPVLTSAQGVGIVVLNAAMNSIDVVVHHDVVGATASHIHTGAAGSSGGIAINLGSPVSPITGTFAISSTDVSSLLAGNLYVNVHTPSFPGGEIRGQIVNQMVPGVFINEYCNDPFGLAGLDTNLDGTDATSSQQSHDEFVEIVNGSTTTVDISNWTLADAVNTRHTFAAGTMLPPLGCITVFGGGSVTNYNSTGRTGVLADTGSIGLNNTSDTMTVADSGALVVTQYAYTSGSADDGNGFSITRTPETAAGTMGSHLTAAGTGHSTGTTVEGILWPAAIVPAPAVPSYPGNGADVDIEVGINGVDDPANTQIIGIHNVNALDNVRLRIFSPGGTLGGNGLLLAFDIQTSGMPAGPITLPGDMAGTGVWLATATASVVLNGLPGAATLFPPALPLGTGSFIIAANIPSIALSGNSFFIQVIMDAPGFNAVNLGVGNAKELAVQ